LCAMTAGRLEDGKSTLFHAYNYVRTPQLRFFKAPQIMYPSIATGAVPLILP
jgi:hypothetical protein